MNTIPIQQLAAAFQQEQIKQRRGNFGQTLNYVEAPTVIQRLNNVLEGSWSFQIVETITEIDEVIVRCRLTVGDVIKEQFGSSRVTRHKDNGDMISLGDDFKAAASDALKKCATLMGIGLQLYADAEPTNSGSNGQQKDARPRPNGNGHPQRVTNEQISRIFVAAKDCGVPQSQVIKLAKESFGTPISQLTGDQAEDLITLIGTAA